MPQVYLLVPLPEGPLAPFDLTTRAVLGAIYDRYKLSSYNFTGGDDRWYDYDIDEIYCIWSQAELAQIVGVSLRSVQRSLALLRSAGVIWTRKPGMQSACNFYIHQSIRDYLSSRQSRQIGGTTPPE